MTVSMMEPFCIMIS